MRHKRRWKIPFLLLLAFHVVSSLDSTLKQNGHKSIFSPRMDYNQWKPIGRGDPLKNDPTFDYVPPVLDHVHYWVDPDTLPSNALLKNPDQKTEILLLGIPSKKPAIQQSSPAAVSADSRRDTGYESHNTKYQDKYYNNYNTNQRVPEPTYFSSVTQIIPSIMSFANKILDRSIFSKGQDTRMPFTVLVPPPPMPPTQSNLDSSQTIATPSAPITQRPLTQHPPLEQSPVAFTSSSPNSNGAVTVQASNLIYQSSSLGSHKEFQSPSPQNNNWEFPSTTQKHYVGYKQNLAPPKSIMRVKFNTHNTNLTNKILEALDSNHNVNYVTPPPLNNKHVMFKGHVSDDNDISNSYVKIEKPQAQMDHMESSEVVYPNSEQFKTPSNFPLFDIQTVRYVETMRPAGATRNPLFNTSKNPVLNLLNKEKNSDSENYIGSSSSVSNTFITRPIIEGSTLAPFLVTTEPEVTTMPPPPPPMNSGGMTSVEEKTTTNSILTTDPLFKHYKQPTVPLRGPLYLIIQGHSKVKTYKPAKQVNGIMVQESNEIPYISDENFDYNIKHLHGYENKKDLLAKSEEVLKQRQARSGNIQTLKHVVQTGLGAIDFNLNNLEMENHRRMDIQQTDLTAHYAIIDNKDVTSEKYRKGIVEEDRS